MLKIATKRFKETQIFKSVKVSSEYVLFFVAAYYRLTPSRYKLHFMDTVHDLYQLSVTQTHSTSSVFTSKHQSNRR
jgi:hypothetical protein